MADSLVPSNIPSPEKVVAKVPKMREKKGKTLKVKESKEEVKPLLKPIIKDNEYGTLIKTL